MLYKESHEELREDVFKDPPAPYRGAPFWAWNCRLKTEQLIEQVPVFKEMGMGGAHIHCRIGLDTPYLGEDFFQNVIKCHEKMKEEGLLCWLYDEDRWPSGTAGGGVTKNSKFRSRFLVWEPYGFCQEAEEGYMAAAKAVRSSERTLLGHYEVILDKEGYLKRYTRISGEECGSVHGDSHIKALSDKNVTRRSVWSAWLEVSGDTPWFNNQAYVNTMDKEAIGEFIRLTHEKYAARLGKDFGKTIPAIFTDEPQTGHKEILFGPFEEKPVVLPFTDDFESSFKGKYGVSVLAHLPELIWERGKGEVSQIRYLYHRHVCERFSEAFGDQVGAWCEGHNLALTGHMMNEWTLYSQTVAAGEVMRPLKAFTLPGIDMLCDRREFSTAKQAQSIARQMGREGCTSEIYGVTGWDFDFRNHKLAGDWQAALGVTVRVPHLTWASMEGEAKRDYPASIGYQSPWYKEYSTIEDHFARLNTVLTRGKPSVDIAVIHPVESYWLYWGCVSQTAAVRQMLETNFENIIQWLLYGLLDFDFISEAVLAEEGQAQEGEGFVMGEMEYRTVIVPACTTLRRNTYERLRAFREAGGHVIFMGKEPEYLDGCKSPLPAALAAQCEQIGYNSSELIEALEKYRKVDVSSVPVDRTDPTRMKHRENGTRTNNMFYQMRKEKDHDWLFLCHVNKPVNEHITYTEKLRITVKGEYIPSLWDTADGNVRKVKAEYIDGCTVITAYTSAHGSLLFKLDTGRVNGEGDVGHVQPEGECIGQECMPLKNPRYLPQPQGYVLEEDNCCLLDLAEYAFDSGPWQQEEELLRIDNYFRQKLGYPKRMEALAQPWTEGEGEKEGHVLKLRFTVSSEIDMGKIELAGENLDRTNIYINGRSVDFKDCGWYVDKSIRRCKIPGLTKGDTIFELHIPFGRKTNIEWYYILGQFGVRVWGRKKVITALPERLYYGDLTTQGFPFYAGNMIYETAVDTEGGSLWIEASHYRGALVQVQVGQKGWKNLILAPYRIDCGRIEKGKHHVRIKVFGNRINAFGAVHNADAAEKWYGPNLWRTTLNKWSYEYQLKEMGLLTTPLFYIKQ